MKTLLKAAAVAVSLGSIFAGNAHADSARLDAVLASQPDSIKARYEYRHPKETLEFFGVEPGMTVVDTLAGEYYSRILLPYLGDDGTLIGVSYSMDQRALDWAEDADRMTRYRTWPDRYKREAENWRGGSMATVDAHLFGSLPASLNGNVDVFLMVRSTHHLHKYEDKAATLTKALADIMRVLKPGGTLGIVQHRAPDTNSDEWAKGFKGYLKEDAVMKAITAAGFEFVGASDVNANPKDKPTEDDYVWRLPPANKDGSNDHIGESDRMTLKFRKPA